jgi:nanoRNase/pAp phosphatase (c-di-AMP/oligoRNAs hydrolase)
MAEQGSNFNALYAYIVANSLFTPRQLSIISNQLKRGSKPEKISSGAYYRQVKQCRKKVISILYSMILLQSTGIVQSEALTTLNKLAEQLTVIFASESSDAMSRLNVNDVISVINEVIKRVSKL